MKITVRSAQSDEIGWINEKYDEVQFVHSHFDKEWIAIAEVNGVKAGLGRIVTIDSQNFELGGIYVFNNFRNLGIAARIVDFLLLTIPKGHIVYCIPFQPLVPFYSKFGFQPVENINDAPKEIQKKFLWCQQTYETATALLVLIAK